MRKLKLIGYRPEELPKKRADDEQEIDLSSLFGGAQTNLSYVEPNKIFFYEQITASSIFKLNTMISQLNEALANPHPDFEFKPYIELHIHSYGGELFSGFAAIDTIQNSKVPIHTYIEGAVASAASMMAVAGKKRYITKNSFVLIHQLSSASEGKFEELKDDMVNNESLMSKIKDIYKKHTKMPAKDLQDTLKRDIWLSAQDCLKYGIVDEIIG